MSTIQILVADRGAARLFECAAPKAALQPLAEFANAGLGTHERDLVSARVGRMRNPTGGRPQTLAARTTAREHAVDTFARAIARRVGGQATARGHDALILVAEPRLLGSIRRHLSKAARARVAVALPLDLGHDSTAELQRRLAPVVREVALELAPRA